MIRQLAQTLKPIVEKRTVCKNLRNTGRNTYDAAFKLKVANLAKHSPVKRRLCILEVEVDPCVSGL